VNRLETLDEISRESKQDAVAVIQSGKNECSNKQTNSITVELTDKCMRSMKKAKLVAPENLCMEHLVYAHPSLLLHVKLLFQLILKHGFVPDSFGFGISIPLIKDKTGNLNDFENYRAITLSCVISKLFQMVVLDINVQNRSLYAT